LSVKRASGFSDPVLWLIIAGGLAGLAVAFALHRDAIPLLPVDLRVGPAGAVTLARDFLRGRGFNPDGFDTVATFFVRRDELDYLHRLGGSPAVESARRRGATLWYWRVRFYRPGDTREFEVWVGTDGRPLGFSYHAPEDEPGARLPPEQAAQLTRMALQDLVGDADGWTPVEVIQQARPRRLDYSVTWEEETPLFADARRRVSFTVQGDRLARIQPYVKVPEAWQRLRAGETQRGSTLASLGWTGAYLLGFGAMILVLSRLGREPLPWRFAAVIAGSFLVISAVAALNGLPLTWAEYNPAIPPFTFLVNQVQGWAGVTGLEATAVFAAALAGPHLVRRAFPGTPDPVSQILGPVTAGQVARWLLIGYGGAAAWLGYFAAYYWAGVRYLGVWAPFEPPYRDIMNTAFPVLFPVTLGLAAALAEESLFRLFALPLGTLALRRLWLGPLAFPATLVGVSLLWGTLHATYPQQPFYVRAIEVGLGGLVSGLLFVRYGLVPVILIHYTGNAAIAGILFWLSGRPDLQASAVVAVGLPLTLAGVRLAFRGRVYRPAAVRPEPEAVPVPVSIGDKAGGWGRTWLALPVAAAVLLGVAVPPYPGQNLRVPVGPDQVVDRAADFASALGPDVSGWLRAVAFVDRSDTAASVYLIRQVGLSQAEVIFGREPLNFVWVVRFARPLEKEAFIVELAPDGEPVGFRHDLPEDARANSLPPDPAQNILQGILRAFRENPAGLRLIAQAQQNRPGRVDSIFVFERRTPLAPDAVVRVGIGLWGDQPGQFGRVLKVPDDFTRRFGGPDLVAAGFRGAAALLGLTLGIWAAAALVRRGLTRGLDVRPGLLAAGLLGLARAVEWLTKLRELYWSYPSTLDVPAFILWQASSDLRTILLQAGAVFLAAVFIRSVRPAPTGAGRGWSVGFIGAGLIGLWYWLAQVLQTLLLEPANHPPVTVIPVELLSRYVPALAAPATRLADSLLLAAGFLAVVGLLHTRFGTGPQVVVAAGLITALAGAATAVETPAALVQFVTFGLLGAGLTWFSLRVAGPGLWALTATLAGARLIADAYFLVRQPGLLFVLNGLLLFPLALIILAAAGRPNLPTFSSD
jgi:hypothetical protein